MKDFAVIFDLDGVLCDSSWREINVSDEEIIQDKVKSENSTLKSILNLYDYKIFIITDRDKKYEEVTKKWLEKFGIYYEEIFFVGYDNVVSNKRKCVKELLKEYDIVYAFDDNIDVVKMYKKLGIQSFLVV